MLVYVIIIQEVGNFRPTTAVDLLSLWVSYGYTHVQSFLMFLFFVGRIFFFTCRNIKIWIFIY